MPVRVRKGVAAGARWTLFPWSSYWRGTHEPKVQAAVLALGGGSVAGWSCWDLGAHFGLYSIGLARRVGPGGEVAAFEPNPASFARLRRHARMNRLAWLKIYEAAASDRAGHSEMFTYGDLGSTGTHLAYDGETREPACKPIPVRTVRLDDLVSSGELRPPDFAKIDVEGHAHRAIQGMIRAMRTRRPILIVAIHSKEEWAGVREVIEPLGYSWESLDTAGAPPWIGRDLICTPSPS
jgi:FkbM family methyltransferase